MAAVLRDTHLTEFILDERATLARRITATDINAHMHMRRQLGQAKADEVKSIVLPLSGHAAMIVNDGCETTLALSRPGLAGVKGVAFHTAAQIAACLPSTGTVVTAPANLAGQVCEVWSRLHGGAIEKIGEEICYRRPQPPKPLPQDEALVYASELGHGQAALEMALCRKGVYRLDESVYKVDKPDIHEAQDLLSRGIDALLLRRDELTCSFQLLTQVKPGSLTEQRHVLMGASCGERDDFPVLFERIANMPNARVSAMVSTDNRKEIANLKAAGFTTKPEWRFETYRLGSPG